MYKMEAKHSSCHACMKQLFHTVCVDGMRYMMTVIVPSHKFDQHGSNSSSNRISISRDVGRWMTIV